MGDSSSARQKLPDVMPRACGCEPFLGRRELPATAGTPAEDESRADAVLRMSLLWLHGCASSPASGSVWIFTRAFLLPRGFGILAAAESAAATAELSRCLLARTGVFLLLVVSSCFGIRFLWPPLPHLGSVSESLSGCSDGCPAPLHDEPLLLPALARGFLGAAARLQCAKRGSSASAK